MRYDIDPIPKPRMTQRDVWKKRPIVLKYHAFKDECRLKRVKLFPAMKIVFCIPMPSSWTKKKREEMDGQPHQQKPDIDNLCKALFDAVLTEDQHIWKLEVEKRWSLNGSITISEII